MVSIGPFLRCSAWLGSFLLYKVTLLCLALAVWEGGMGSYICPGMLLSFWLLVLPIFTDIVKLMLSSVFRL